MLLRITDIADPKCILLDTLSFFDDSSPSVIKRRKTWVDVDFVKAKRANWEPTNYSNFFKYDVSPWECTLLESNSPGGSARRGNRSRFANHFDRKTALLSHVYLVTVHRINFLNIAMKFVNILLRETSITRRDVDQSTYPCKRRALTDSVEDQKR